MAVIDLLTILPAFTILGDYFKLFRIVRMVKSLRLLKLLNLMRAFRYSKTLRMIGSVIRNSKEALVVVASFACFYILISALLVFNVEPDTFNTFFDAIYWATVSLTTVGYGDLYPVTAVGKAISMLSSFFGIAVIALPASIITAGYVKALDEYVDEKKTKKQKTRGDRYS
jgi:voltage-gated potassium channel